MSQIKFVPEQLNLFFEWVRERESVRIKKENGAPKPWTKNAIIRDTRWCNVRRMDDRVSRWLVNNWYVPARINMNNVRVMYLMHALLARYINWPETLALLPRMRDGQGWQPYLFNDVLPVLQGIQNDGAKVFTGAYIVNPGRGGNKCMQVVQLVNEATGMYARVSMCTTYEEAHRRLMEQNGVGSFMAGQVIADLLNYKRFWEHGVPTDIDTWAPVGVGSRRGMRRLTGGPAVGSMTQEVFTEHLTELIKVFKKRCPAIYADRQLIAMDVQNCLCEFDKYARLTYGEGRSKNKYDGMPETRDLF